MPPVLFAGVPVADHPAARAWYERLFGRGPDMVPNQTEVVWQVAEGGWVYVVADAAGIDFDELIGRIVEMALQPA